MERRSEHLSVLIAQTALYAGQHTLISARLAGVGNLVTLYKDLGDGWIQHTGEQPRPPDAFARKAVFG